MGSRALPQVVWRLRMVICIVLAIAAVLACHGSVALGAQTITLLADADPRADATPSSQPSQFYTIGATTYFAATDSVHGRQLWKTNGLAAGTTLVKDAVGITQQNVDCQPTALHDILYYCESSKVWRSDGTPQGTWLLQQVNPDDANTISQLTASDDRIYFVTQSNRNSSNGAFVLWASDGTPEGTVAIKKLGGYVELEAVGSVLYFGDSGYLWKTDGTVAGTVSLISGHATKLVHLGNKLLFSLEQTYGNSDLYRTDGTVQGTVRISDVVPNLSWAVVGDTLFFGATGLWKTDGTTEGTVFITTLPYPEPSSLTAVGNKLFLVVLGQTGYELWTSDGTAAGTGRVKNLRPDWDGDYFYSLTAVGDALYFVTDDREQSGFVFDLWRSDGSESGTSIVWKSTINQAPTELHDANGILLFSCATPEAGQELCRSDGTSAGTGLLRDLNVNYGDSSYAQLMSVGDRVYFTSPDTGGHTAELWTSDGTAAGTREVKDSVSGNGGSSPQQLTNVAGKLFFSAQTPAQGRELWTSDGTSAGTTLVKDITSGAESTDLLYLTALDTRLAFFTTDGQAAPTVRLWISDGTADGTTVIKEWKSSTNQYPVRLTKAIGSQLYFAVDDGEHGVELWTSDGTTAGTHLVIDLMVGAESSLVSPPVALGGAIYFAQYDGQNGCQCVLKLWRSDGTAAGTTVVKNFEGVSNQPHLVSLLATKQALFFLFDENGGDRGLWTSDGTTVGTRLVLPKVNAAPEALDDVVVFRHNDAQYGEGVWRSDGTTRGTTRITDISLGASGSIDPSISRFPGTNTVGFTADNGRNGTELWVSDATTEGTHMVADIERGPGSSTPWAWVKAGDTFVTVAANSTVGRALWAVTGLNSAPTVAPQTIQVQSDGSVSGTLSAQDADGDPLEFSITVQPHTGTVVITDSTRGTFTYTAFAGASGTDEWSYSVWDGQNETRGTISVHITQPSQHLFIPLVQR